MAGIRRLPLPLDRSLRKEWALFALAAVTVVAICWVPYHVPMEPTVSDSYVFGYNNRAGEALLLVGAFLVALLKVDVSGRPVPSKALSGSSLRKALAGTMALSAILFLLTRKLGGFQESIYFIDRVNEAVAGLRPYSGFEFPYGPAFIYGPVWLSRWFHLRVNDGYLLFWMLLALTGTYLLYKTILWIDEPPGKQRAIFLFLWAMSLGGLLSTGLNYCFFRYILPCWLGLLIYRRMNLAVEGKASAALPLLLPVPFLALLLLVSPEMALGFGAGVVAYLAWFGRLRTGRNGLWFALMLAGMGAVLWLASRLGLFMAVDVFRRGGMNFPIMPALHLLLLFFCVGLVACYVGARVRSREPSALMMLIAVSTVTLASGLGRCDSGHALYNPLGIWIAAWFIAAGMPSLWRWLWPAQWLVFFLIPIGPAIFQTGSLLFKAALPRILASEPMEQTTTVDRWVLKRMTGALGAQRAAVKFANIKALAHSSDVIDVPALFGQKPGTVFEAPLGFAPNRFGTYHSPSIDEGYFFENFDIVLPSQVTRKVAEMASYPQRPLLLLPGWEDNFSDAGPSSTSGLSHLFLYPYNRPVVHSENLTRPIYDYIEQHYRLAESATPQHFGYELWMPNEIAPTGHP